MLSSSSRPSLRTVSQGQMQHATRRVLSKRLNGGSVHTILTVVCLSEGLTLPPFSQVALKSLEESELTWASASSRTVLWQPPCSGEPHTMSALTETFQSLIDLLEISKGSAKLFSAGQARLDFGFMKCLERSFELIKSIYCSSECFHLLKRIKENNYWMDLLWIYCWNGHK